MTLPPSVQAWHSQEAAALRVCRSRAVLRRPDEETDDYVGRAWRNITPYLPASVLASA
ncbi:hypothetical protein [Saccharopolyspora pogona]|uniref:hypothetical protein n=1 Tax=Saccharopolyspora pogona TaxID=333966 RepID=UPI001682B780|nr:hypothetical protein [Saccharopolyspora pogona]